MQLTEYKLSQLLNNTNNKLSPVYFLHGDEKFIIKKYINQIIELAKKQNFNEVIKQTIDAQTPPENIIQHIQTKSLFAQKQCIIFQHSQFPAEKLYKPIIRYLENPDPDIILIITCKKLSKAQQKNNYTSILNKTGISTAIWPPQDHQLPQWIQKRAQHYKLSLDYQAINLIISQTENNLEASDQLLKKVSCKNKRNISPEDIIPLISENSGQSKHNVFELIDSALYGDLRKTKKIFSYLKTMKTESHLIIWMAIKSLRTLCNIHQGLKTQKLESLYPKYQIWPKRQKIIQKALKRLNYNKCLNLIRHAYEIELTTKGADDLLYTDGWKSLEIYIFSIAGVDEEFLKLAKIQ